MNVIITPKRLTGAVNAVSSKSDGHRKIIAASLSDKPTYININNFSDDIDATLSCIESLGGGYERDEKGVLITPISGKNEYAELDFRESGSTARFLLPVSLAVCGEIHAVGRGRLPERPMGELTEQLRLHNAEVSADYLPICAKGPITGGEYRLSGSISSQYLTGLLFALPLLKEESRITLTTPLASASYVDMTLDTLSEFGIGVDIEGSEYRIKPQRYISPERLSAEGDWSSAAFWIAADKICGGIEVLGLNNASHQGDREITRLLDTCDIDAAQIPDLVPILAVLAAAREGETVIRNAARLRLKESDRLKAVCDMLNALGGAAHETDDGMIINGTGRLSGGTVDGCGDHRIVMSAAIASVICKEKVEITGAEAVKKSYPTFFRDFISLGGDIVERN